MSQVIGQVWREVVGCRNWPIMRVPLSIALRRNENVVCQMAAILSKEKGDKLKMPPSP